MINYGQLFSDFDSVASALESTFNSSNNLVNRITDKVYIPMNIYKEEDGTQVIEIAAVGLKKEDIAMTIKTENGQTYLYIKSTVPEKSEEQKKAEEKRVYTIRKIKNLADLDARIWLPSTLNVDEPKSSLVNGLLTIRFKTKEEAKPRQITIDG